jgi:hypothetical protein
MGAKRALYNFIVPCTGNRVNKFGDPMFSSVPFSPDNFMAPDRGSQLSRKIHTPDPKMILSGSQISSEIQGPRQWLAM